jgi:ATP-dependent Clp protease protease subunit
LTTQTTAEQERQNRKRELRELELREQRATTERTEIELEQARLEYDTARRRHEIEKTHGFYNGRFSLIGEITEAKCHQLRSELQAYSLLAPDSTIELTISSPGGSVFAGWALFDSLRQLSDQGHSIVTVACGMAASMAGVILQAGTLRIMGAETHLMIHEVSSFAIGKTFELKDEAELVDRLTQQMCQVYARKSTLTADEISARCSRRDWWLTAKEALDLGFVDMVSGLRG